MGKSGKKPRESHRQGRGRRASHFGDEDGDDLPSSAYDAPPCQNEDSSDDNDDTSEATAEDEPDGCMEASKHTNADRDLNAGQVSPIVAYRTGKSTSFGRCLDL